MLYYNCTYSVWQQSNINVSCYLLICIVLASQNRRYSLPNVFFSIKKNRNFYQHQHAKCLHKSKKSEYGKEKYIYIKINFVSLHCHCSSSLHTIHYCQSQNDRVARSDVFAEFVKLYWQKKIYIYEKTAK